MVARGKGDQCREQVGVKLWPVYRAAELGEHG